MEEKFNFKPIKVFREQHSNEKNLVRLWVVKWGNSNPVLEKRRIWIDTDGSEKPRKMVGLNRDDLEFILDNQESIKMNLQVKEEDK